jgi:hypothetical protein
VHAEDLAADGRGERQPRKDCVEAAPDGLARGAEALDALVAEAVLLVDLGRLVVAAQQEDAVRVLDLRTAGGRARGRGSGRESE